MAITDVFDRYDFLTTIIPGATFVVAVAFLFASAGVFDLELTAEVLLVIGVGVFLVGEVITMFTDTADPGQRLFTFMLLSAEVRLELNELEESIERQVDNQLPEEQQTEEGLRATVLRLTEYKWDEVESWDREQQRLWAWAHVWVLVNDESEFPRRDNPVFTLTKDRNTDLDHWIRFLEYRNDKDHRDRRYVEKGPVFISRDILSFIFGGFEIEFLERERLWTEQSLRFHERQLLQWLNADKDALEEWFNDELWDDLSDWTGLYELGSLSENVQSNWSIIEPNSETWLTIAFRRRLEWFGWRVSSILPGFTWFSKKFSHTDPPSWIDEPTIRHLRQHFQLSSLQDQVTLNPRRDSIYGYGPSVPWIVRTNRDVISNLYHRRYADMFRVLFAMVETDLGSQANRFRSRSVFHHNMGVTLGIIALLYVLVALLRVLGVVLDDLQNGLFVMSNTLERLFNPLVNFLDGLFGPMGRIIGVDWLAMMGVVVFLFLSLLWMYFRFIVVEFRPDGIRTYRPRRIWLVLTGLALAVLLSAGFFQLLSASRPLAFLWFVLVGLTGFWGVYFKHRRTSLFFIQRAAFPLMVAFSAFYLTWSIVLGNSTIEVVVATADRLVLGLGWLILITLIVLLLWPMFSVWKRRHEYEYLRYLLTTYYTVYINNAHADKS